MGGVFMLPISAENRMLAHVSAGDEVEVEVEPDTQPREVSVPPDFLEVLGGDADARRFFDGLSSSSKQRVVLSIEGAKNSRDTGATHHQSGRDAARGPHLILSGTRVACARLRNECSAA